MEVLGYRREAENLIGSQTSPWSMVISALHVSSAMKAPQQQSLVLPCSDESSRDHSDKCLLIVTVFCPMPGGNTAFPPALFCPNSLSCLSRAVTTKGSCDLSRSSAS
jgi:hypothetical protein